MKTLYVVNESTLVTSADVKKMAAACDKQVHLHAAPAWGIDRVAVHFHTGSLASVQQTAPKGSWVITIMDSGDQPGALGWHSEDDQDRIYGEIFAKPCLDSGSTALTGTYAVSSVLSHEVLETLCDRYCNAWTDTGRGFLVATEVCDPVESDGYLIDGVQVSNFVLPEWFDITRSAGEAYDYLGKLTAPLSMSKGGYWVQMPAGKEAQKFNEIAAWEKDTGFDVRDDDRLVFSPEMPEWRRDLKTVTGRNLIKRTAG